MASPMMPNTPMPAAPVAAARPAAPSPAQMQQMAMARRQALGAGRMGPGPNRAKGGPVKSKKYAKGGSVSSASKRADGCVTKGKTKGKFV